MFFFMGMPPEKGRRKWRPGPKNSASTEESGSVGNWYPVVSASAYAMPHRSCCHRALPEGMVGNPAPPCATLETGSDRPHGRLSLLPSLASDDAGEQPMEAQIRDRVVFWKGLRVS
jgi:hypothetical protein